MTNTKVWMWRFLSFVPFLLPVVMRYRVPQYHHVSLLWSVPLTFLYLYLSIPFFDHIAGRSRGNPDLASKPWIASGGEYVLLPQLLCLQVMVLKVVAFIWIVQGKFTTVDLVGTAFLCGQVLGSYGIYVAHELMHRPSRFDKALAEILLVTVMYPHFCIEHVVGHHKHVGTYRDPATARFNESLYRFVVRSVFGGAVSAWRIETERLRARGLPWLTMHNRMLRYSVEISLLNAAVYYFGGIWGSIAFLIHCAIAIFAFETINYVQHYGLQRKELAPGVFEPVSTRHSWDSSHRFSNLFLLNLGRHADHHRSPARPFQTLRLFREHEAPELPWGIVTMFVVAFVPPLWFRVMNPRALAWREKSVVPLTAAYSRLPTSNELDPDAALSALRRAYARGETRIGLTGLNHQTRRAILLSRYEMLFGFLIVPAIAITIVINNVWRPVWGLTFLFVACLVALAARRVLANYGSSEAVIPAALGSLHTWDLLWRTANVEIRFDDDPSKRCSSPADDWHRFVCRYLPYKESSPAIGWSEEPAG